MQPDVSVVVPVYNNEQYVPTCIESLMAQTLKNIEIICINDGSTDSSPELLHAYAERDGRVRVIDKENGGYGVGINRGLDEARGKYVTILESDDFADLDMLETLFNYAEAYDLDIVRANFSLYWSSKVKNDTFLELFAPFECDRVIDPSVRENQHCFYVQPAIWSALYRRDFLMTNQLRLTETPGAAYQDTAFNFKLWACARRVMFVHRPFIHYRQDNEASSINNPHKVYNICVEYEEVNRWLTEERPELRANLAPVMYKMMCDAYTWNTGRIDYRYRAEFVKRYGEALKKGVDAGEVDRRLFAPGQFPMVMKTITDPQAFIDFVTKGKDPATGFELVSRKVSTAMDVWRQQGLKGVTKTTRERYGSEGHAPTTVERRDNELATRKPPVFIKGCDVRKDAKISVILTVYNTAPVLAETLDSILSQTLHEFELIVIDDGSTDDSNAILRSYAEKDDRIALVTQENRGVSEARNRGIDMASAPYLLILDGDDIFMPEMFQKLYDSAVSNESDIAVCASYEYNGETFESTLLDYALKMELLPKNSLVFAPYDVADVLFEAFMGWPWDRIYRTEFVRKVGLRFPTMANSEDAFFVYGLLVNAERISIVPEGLIKHRSSRTGSISNSRLKNPEAFYDAITMTKKYIQSNDNWWALYAKSYLNWALDYTLWNIMSLPKGKQRKELANKFVNNFYREIEYDSHEKGYFDLYPDFAIRIAKVRLMALYR